MNTGSVAGGRAEEDAPPEDEGREEGAYAVEVAGMNVSVGVLDAGSGIRLVVNGVGFVWWGLLLEFGMGIDPSGCRVGGRRVCRSVAGRETLSQIAASSFSTWMPFSPCCRRRRWTSSLKGGIVSRGP